MKKLLFSTLCALVGSIVMAAEYQIYDIKLNARTTASKGKVEKDCGEYVYRDKSSAVIKGVLGGCGCGSILANGVCDNAILYMWDETHKVAITNVDTTTGWRVQRIGKNETVVEHFVQLTAFYGDDDQYSFDIVLAGFGTYKINKNSDDACYASSISGNFAGIANAPNYFKKGSCSACGFTPSEIAPTDAISLCETCDVSLDSDKTPFFGTYTVKYNSTKGKKVSKNGLSQKDLGLPDYVGLTDFVATNIGD